jgi:putative spermidine/putrescine transport system permease protein
MADPRNLLFGAAIWTVAGFAMLLLAAPTAIVVLMSFTGDLSLRFPPRSWSVRWYVELLENSPQILASAVVSLKVAVIATLVAATLGTLAAVAIAGRRERWAVALDAAFMSPMVFPAMSLGLALLLLLSVSGIPLSTWTLAMGHVVVVTPFVIRMVSASAQQMDPSLLDCAASLGASRAYRFFTNTLPLIRPGVLAGSVVAFLASIDHVPVSLMLSDPRTETLPIHLWAILESNLDVRVAAVSGVMVALTMAVVLMLDRRIFAARSRP